FRDTDPCFHVAVEKCFGSNFDSLHRIRLLNKWGVHLSSRLASTHTRRSLRPQPPPNPAYTNINQKHSRGCPPDRESRPRDGLAADGDEKRGEEAAQLGAERVEGAADQRLDGARGDLHRLRDLGVAEAVLAVQHERLSGA